MEIKIVDSTKDTKCDILIINKCEEKETSNALVNKFAPETFKGKAGEMFLLHTHGQCPSTYILTIGFGKEEKLDGNVIRENVANFRNRNNYRNLYCQLSF